MSPCDRVCVFVWVCICHRVCPQRSHVGFWLCVSLKTTLDVNDNLLSAIASFSHLLCWAIHDTLPLIYETHHPSVTSFKQRFHGVHQNDILSFCGFSGQTRDHIEETLWKKIWLFIITVINNHYYYNIRCFWSGFLFLHQIPSSTDNTHEAQIVKFQQEAYISTTCHDKINNCFY